MKPARAHRELAREAQRRREAERAGRDLWFARMNELGECTCEDDGELCLLCRTRAPLGVEVGRVEEGRHVGA